MQRTVLMIHSAQHNKLSKFAASEKVSIAEINRRAIDAYNPQAITDTELEKLAELTIKSNAAAHKALKEAQQELKKTLTHFAKQRKTKERN